MFAAVGSMRTREKGRKGRTKESSSENSFCNAIGLWSAHVESYHGGGGWPDRYFGGGLWVEFKAFMFIRKSYKGRPPALHKLVRESQKRRIPELIAQGDRVFVCVFVHTADEPGKRFLIVPYDEFLNLNEREVDERAITWSPTSTEAIEYVHRTLSRRDQHAAPAADREDFKSD